LWRAYLQDRGWSELHKAGFAQPNGDELADTLRLRRAVVEIVHALPAGIWIRFEALSAWIQRTRPAVIREQLNARGLVTLEALDWLAFEQKLLHHMLLGPLYWLGQIALSSDGRILTLRPAATAGALRIAAQSMRDSAAVAASTPRTLAAEDGSQATGDAAVAAEDLAAPIADARASPATAGAMRSERRVASEACVWEGVAELVAPPRADLGTLLDAERYLVLHERGRPSRYHLVQAHVAAALATGGSIADCRRLLLKLTRSAPPETIEERLAAWEQRFGALSVRPAVVLESRSEAELNEAIADERVRPFVRARLGETVVEVAAAQALELAAVLREGGHLPRVDAALRLSAEPRRAYAGLVDEHVLEFLLVSLLAFQRARPEYLDSLEGSLVLLERLERQFPPQRLAELRAAAAGLAGYVGSAPSPPRPRPKRRRTKRQL
jgi:hypothetical protein